MSAHWQLAVIALAQVAHCTSYSLAPHFPLETGQSDQSSGSCLPTSLPTPALMTPSTLPNLLGQSTTLAAEADTHERKDIGFNEHLLCATVCVPSMVVIGKDCGV